MDRSAEASTTPYTTFDTPTPDRRITHEHTAIDMRAIPLPIKVYGFICIVYGIISLLTNGSYLGIAAWTLITNPQAIIGIDQTLPIVILAVGLIITSFNSIALALYGRALIRNRRRRAALGASLLIATTLIQLLCDVMLQGIGPRLIFVAAQLLILITISITIDPSLRQERARQRELRLRRDEEAAAAGMLGRDPKGRGYLKLNYFNLFWVFMVCCVLGLAIEVVYHMTVVDPGVYQDRAGLLFGPFSPIYGVGASLLTVALNRFYRAHPAIIFIVSAIIGGLFESFVSWFMQTAFGAVAWDYTGITIFGAPDPIAILFHGRTSTPFMLMWGALGLAWIRLCLPWLLALINRIPWKMRYSLTCVVSVLMLINAVMTLQALDCWFERVSGVAGVSPVEEFYARNFDNAYMEDRFQSMTIHPEDTGRVNDSAVVETVMPS